MERIPGCIGTMDLSCDEDSEGGGGEEGPADNERTPIRNPEVVEDLIWGQGGGETRGRSRAKNEPKFRRRNGLFGTTKDGNAEKGGRINSSSFSRKTWKKQTAELNILTGQGSKVKKSMGEGCLG